MSSTILDEFVVSQVEVAEDKGAVMWQRNGM